MLKNLQIPDPCLILLIGPSGSGKSSFARRNFGETEVLSSDRLRAILTDDEDNQSVSGAVFSLLRQITRIRMQHGRLTVIDATNLGNSSRRSFLQLAEAAQIATVAIVFCVELAQLEENNSSRVERIVPVAIIKNQIAEMETAKLALLREHYAQIHWLTWEEIKKANVTRISPGNGPMTERKGASEE